MAEAKPVGIDLGTTNSAVAWMDPSGRSAMVPNTEGDLLTPSVVLFGASEVVVGKEARNATTLTPDRVAQWVKRDMGSPSYRRPIQGRLLPPEVIQACILKKLKTDLLGVLGPDTKVVITVPAYFDEPRRKATADAGEMAGLAVLDIVNEPTAAALAFGETAGYLSATGSPKAETTLLVYDLGGGTFDVTLLKLAPANIQTIATDGDVQLGGHDWDERLIDYLAEEFINSHGVDPRTDPAGLGRLYNAAVEAKHTLSARNRATVRLDHQGKSAEIEITREKFQELSADLLQRTAYTTRQLVAEAKMEWKDVSRMLLVGGATRMPMVAEMLQEMTGITPDHTVNPDEAVARGAALFAGYLLAKPPEGGSPPAFEVTNVNAHSLGVEGIDQETLRKKNVVLIRRNTPLPAKFTEQFITKSEGQRSIVLQVLEGESSLPGECTAIGRTAIHNLPAGLPKGWPIEVTFEYATNGRLNVRAVVPGTPQDATLQLERVVGLSEEGIARWKNPVGSSAGFDAFESMVVDLLGPAKAKPSPDKEGAWSTEPPMTGEPAADDKPTDAEQPPDGEPVPDVPSRPAPVWMITVIGYVTSAIVGLGLGYLVLSWLRRDSFPLPW